VIDVPLSCALDAGPEQCARSVARVGVGIAIDNFGSQYSSLDYCAPMSQPPENRARDDRRSDAEPGGVAMVRAILSLAGNWYQRGRRGVETDTQRKLLVQASAQTQGQGFLYSAQCRPMKRCRCYAPASSRPKRNANKPPRGAPGTQRGRQARRGQLIGERAGLPSGCLQGVLAA